MAEREHKEQGALPAGDGAETQPEWHKALLYTQENPTKVAGGVGFLLLCVVIGGVFSLQKKAEDMSVTTEYAAALKTEDPGLRADALEEIASGSTRWNVEALYLRGESAIEAKAYEQAREAFQTLVAQHSDSEYAPVAADGLAFLDENEDKLDEALAGYTKVFETWDDTLTGRRQPLNIARVQEKLGNHAEAVKRYEQQMEIFPESTVARKSEAALARLKGAMPELFPEEAVEVEETTETVATEVEEAAPVEAAPVEAAPAEAAPVEAAPVEAAPVEAAPVEAAPAEAAPVEAAPEAATE